MQKSALFFQNPLPQPDKPSHGFVFPNFNNPPTLGSKRNLPTTLPSSPVCPPESGSFFQIPPSQPATPLHGFVFPKTKHQSKHGFVYPTFPNPRTWVRSVICPPSSPQAPSVRQNRLRFSNSTLTATRQSPSRVVFPKNTRAPHHGFVFPTFPNPRNLASKRNLPTTQPSIPIRPPKSASFFQIPPPQPAKPDPGFVFPKSTRPLSHGFVFPTFPSPPSLGSKRNLPTTCTELRSLAQATSLN